MLVAVVGEYGSTISSVANSLGQNFTRLMQANSWDSTGRAEIWYLPAPTAGAQTVTANFGSAVGEGSISIMLVTNVATITSGTITFRGSGARSNQVGPDTVSTTANDLAGSGTVYFRQGLTWTPTGVGQVVQNVSDNIWPYTSTRMATMPATSGTSALGYTVGSIGTEFSDMAFKLSHP
jgi:hypothetical protein